MIMHYTHAVPRLALDAAAPMDQALWGRS